MDKLNILAIDYNSLFARNWHASGGAERGEAYQRTVQWVQQARGGYDRVALCCDSGHKSFRVALWPEYKGTRPAADAMYVEALRKTQERLRADGCCLFVAPDLGDLGGHAEGDDVIGALCAWAAQRGHEVTIASGDKDILQLARDASEGMPAVRCLSLTTGAVKTCADVIQDFGVPPHLLPELFALAGDSSDNYKPLPGVGLKKAAELLKLTGGSAVALSDPEVLARVRDVVGDALAAKIKQIDGLRDRLIRAKRVAMILDSLPIDFAALEAEPVYEKPPEAEKPAPRATAIEVVAAEPKAEAIVKRSQRTEMIERFRLNPYALEPRNPQQAMMLAESIHASRLYSHFATPEAVLTVILEGRALGMPSIVALKNAVMVKGRVGWYARTLRGLCLKSDLCEYFDIVESTHTHALGIYKRIGRPERQVKTTLEDAEKRGLILEPKNGKEGNKWHTDPLSMCVADVERRGARLGWPEIVNGLYTPDEIELGLNERGIELLEAVS